MRRLLFILAALAFIVVHVTQIAHAGGATLIVRVGEEATARGETITLGDIAEVSATGDGELATRARAVPLGYAPEAGAVREITRARIMLALAAAGFPAATVQLDAPASVLIRRATQRIDPALVREAVERVALSELRAAGAAEARVVSLTLPPLIETPAGELNIKATVGALKNYFAPFVVTVELSIGGRVVRRLSATAQIEATASIFVAAHDLPVNSRVRAEDLTTEVRRIERPPAAYLRDTANLRGSSARKLIARGEVINIADLYADIVVRAGERVAVRGESGIVAVTIAGEAQTAGRVGDRVRVKNLQSGALVEAVVVDEGLVRVRF